MAKERQMCLNCSTRPAMSSSDTVPLCSVCKEQANNPRGVEYQDKKKPKQAAAAS